MRKEMEQYYEETDELRKILDQYKGRKFKLDCGHHATIGHCLGSNIMIYNGSKFKIICSLCSY